MCHDIFQLALYSELSIIKRSQNTKKNKHPDFSEITIET